MNLHITPVDYYSPIPSTLGLDPKIFEKIYDDTGLDWNVSGQMDYLTSIFIKYSGEYTPTPNIGLSLVDSFILYAMIRETKPKVMIEVGSGESTKITLLAIEMNEREGTECQFYAVDPYPPIFLRQISKRNFKLVDKKLEEVDIDLLITADLFFIDSSHVSKIGSDVNYEILEIVPKLKRGAIIHWHDIMIPKNYWEDWIYKGTMFWNESYILHAFLLFNDTFKIIWGSRYMQLNHSDEMKQHFCYFQPEKHRCTSFWVQRVK
ncbi:MAG: hypothetical protein A2Y66_03150 [Nitrospirae bacterium RBG_13_41_22]|nr:MAG: hypothetical protein A2Y66_03150 [Nitrospirae bacterium RBG_13_41_22]